MSGGPEAEGEWVLAECHEAGIIEPDHVDADGRQVYRSVVLATLYEAEALADRASAQLDYPCVVVAGDAGWIVEPERPPTAATVVQHVDQLLAAYLEAGLIEPAGFNAKGKQTY